MKVTLDIAELIGIIMGDGNIICSNKINNVRYRLIITGHKTDDYNYLTNHTSNLIFNIFKKKPNLWEHKNKNAIALALYSKEIISYLAKDIGLISNYKKNLSIPKVILEGNKQIKASFLRGIADTDFSILFGKKKRKAHFYPSIQGTTKSFILAKQIKQILTEFGIKCNIHKRKRLLNNKLKLGYQLDIYGHYNFSLWMDKIGFSNKKHLSKIEVWKKLGYYTPYTSYEDRLKILEQ